MRLLRRSLAISLVLIAADYFMARSVERTALLAVVVVALTWWGGPLRVLVAGGVGGGLAPAGGGGRAVTGPLAAAAQAGPEEGLAWGPPDEWGGAHGLRR
jgi:hypothetical protein